MPVSVNVFHMCDNNCKDLTLMIATSLFYFKTVKKKIDFLQSSLRYADQLFIYFWISNFIFENVLQIFPRNRFQRKYMAILLGISFAKQGEHASCAPSEHLLNSMGIVSSPARSKYYKCANKLILGTQDIFSWSLNFLGKNMWFSAHKLIYTN